MGYMWVDANEYGLILYVFQRMETLTVTGRTSY
jgi:hypothetical protein